MKERRILIAAILVVTVFCVSVVPSVQKWWKKDAEVTAEAEEGGEPKVANTSYNSYNNFDEEIKNHKIMTIDLKKYGYNYEIIHKDRNYEIGSKENPFIILEIVPHECYAEFGYIVPGSEPIGFENTNLKYYVKTQSDEAHGWTVLGALAANIVANFNRISTGTDELKYPLWVEEKFGYAEYYSRNNASEKIEGDKFPDNYLVSTAIGKVFGKFFTKVDGEYEYREVTAVENGETVSYMQYVGKGGNYSFEPIITPSATWVSYIKEKGNYKEIPVYDLDGVSRSTAMIPQSVPAEDVENTKTYAYYDKKFGYFLKIDNKYGDVTNDIDLSGTGTACSGITVKSKGSGGWRFVEESGAVAYFFDNLEEMNIKRKDSEDMESFKKYQQIDFGENFKDLQTNTTEDFYAFLNYYRPTEYCFHNDQTEFFTETLGLSKGEIENYHIKVLTVTPDILNAMGDNNEWDLIDAADFISFKHNFDPTWKAVDLWKNYYNERFFTNEQKSTAAAEWSFQNNDISWAVTMRLLCKISIMQDDDFPNAPVVASVGCYINHFDTWVPLVRHYADGTKVEYGTNGSSNNNVVKLFMMLLTFETEEDAYFYNHYIKTQKVVEKEISTSAGTTGYFKYIVDENSKYSDVTKENLEKAALYWNPYTFLDFENIYYASKPGENSLDSDAGGSNLDKLWTWSNMIKVYEGDSTNTSVRNNVYTYNNNNSMTHQINSSSFEYVEKDIFKEEPFEIIEFCDRDKLTGYDIMYYLLNQERSSLNVLINGSLDSKVYSNVDYEADNAKIALEVGQIINKKDDTGNNKLYGRVQFNIKLNTRKGDETDLSKALVQFNIYREDVFDDSTTMELENLIPVTEAYLLSELQKDELDRVKSPLKLGLDYYYDVPLELLEGIIENGELKNAKTTEDVKFNAVVCYGLKDRNQEMGFTEEDYRFKKNIAVYDFEQDENGKITKVKKDERKTLTFVRRAMFNLD